MIDHTLDSSASIGGLLSRLASTTTTVELIERSLDALYELVPSDSVIFDEVSLCDGRTRGATRPANLVHEWADMMPTFEKWFMQSPNVQYFQQHPNGPARRWSDGDMETFRSTQLYREFMEPLGIHFQLSFSLPGNADSQRAFILNRREADFTDDEVAICNEVAPYLSALFATSMQRMLGLVDGLNASGTWSAYIVDQTSRIVRAAVQPNDETAGTDDLDLAVRQWVLQQLSERDLRLSRTAVSTELTLECGAVTSVQLMPDAAGSHVLIMSAPQTPARTIEPDAITGLSTRQREVIEQLVAGGTNQQIAQRLGISVETVKKHLNAIFRELDVADRASAIAAVHNR